MGGCLYDHIIFIIEDLFCYIIGFSLLHNGFELDIYDEVNSNVEYSGALWLVSSLPSRPPSTYGT